jgi:ABC-type glycerol-3-phosphate transport system permease component
MIYAVLLLGCVVFLVPFYFVVNGSLKTDAAVQAGDFVTPATDPQWWNYPEAMERLGLTRRDPTIPTADRLAGSSAAPASPADQAAADAAAPKLLIPTFPALSNTVVITTLTIAGQILSCSLVGFGFARFRFRGRDTLFILMLSTMMLPAQVTMIPLFVLFKELA